MFGTLVKLASVLAIGTLATLFAVHGDNVVSCSLRNAIILGPSLLETEVSPGRSRFSVSNGAIGMFCAVEQTEIDSFKHIQVYSHLLSDWSRIGPEPCGGYVKGRLFILTYLDPPRNKEYIASAKYLPPNLSKWSGISTAGRQCGRLEADDLMCELTRDGEQYCSVVERAN